jgi:phospholipid/cholesterol/gamma-HCH transport system ATP-binding protein
MTPAPASSTLPSKPFIQIRGLQKAFGQQKVLQGINLDIHHGETLVLIGPSGEGKSVLLKHIIGLLQPDAGSIDFEGIPICSLKERQFTSVRRRMGYLFQNGALFDSITVAQNVAFPLVESTLKNPAEINQRVHEALEVVELSEHKDKMPINLSGGMRKRVGIARAIVAARRSCSMMSPPPVSIPSSPTSSTTSSSACSGATTSPPSSSLMTWQRLQNR